MSNFGDKMDNRDSSALAANVQNAYGIGAAAQLNLEEIVRFMEPLTEVQRPRRGASLIFEENGEPKVNPRFKSKLVLPRPLHSQIPQESPKPVYGRKLCSEGSQKLASTPPQTNYDFPQPPQEQKQHPQQLRRHLNDPFYQPPQTVSDNITKELKVIKSQISDLNTGQQKINDKLNHLIRIVYKEQEKTRRIILSEIIKKESLGMQRKLDNTLSDNNETATGETEKRPIPTKASTSQRKSSGADKKQQATPPLVIFRKAILETKSDPRNTLPKSAMMLDKGKIGWSRNMNRRYDDKEKFRGKPNQGNIVRRPPRVPYNGMGLIVEETDVETPRDPRVFEP